MIKKNNNDFQCYVVKVLNKHKECTSRILIEALKHTLIVDVRIIVLCLATQRYTKELESIIRELNENNKIIIASLENEAEFSYPAIFKECIGVKGMLLHRDVYKYNPNEQIEVICNSSPIYIFNGKKNLRVYSGNSKATGLFASKVIGMLSETDTVETIREKLIEKACSNIEKHSFIKHIIKHADSCQLSRKDLSNIEKLYYETKDFQRVDLETFFRAPLWEIVTTKKALASFLLAIFETLNISTCDIIIHRKDCVNMKVLYHVIKSLIKKNSGGSTENAD